MHTYANTCVYTIIIYYMLYAIHIYKLYRQHWLHDTATFRCAQPDSCENWVVFRSREKFP